MSLRSRAANPSYEQIWRPIPAALPGMQLCIGRRPGFPAPAAVRRSQNGRRREPDGTRAFRRHCCRRCRGCEGRGVPRACARGRFRNESDARGGHRIRQSPRSPARSPRLPRRRRPPAWSAATSRSAPTTGASCARCASPPTRPRAKKSNSSSQVPKRKRPAARVSRPFLLPFLVAQARTASVRERADRGSRWGRTGW